MSVFRYTITTSDSGTRHPLITASAAHSRGITMTVEQAEQLAADLLAAAAQQRRVWAAMDEAEAAEREAA